MVRIPRKLFPTITTNETQSCADFCDPSCPYNCYTIPEFYLPPPPPPPPPPLTSAADHFFSGNHISSYLIILGSLFAFLFVLLGIYVIKSKCYAIWCGWRDHFPHPSESDSSEQEFLDDNRVDHPVWLITTVGLRQSIINSITVFKYKRGEGLVEGTECSVCLNEFKEGETLRLLPKCNHAFHIPCIDTWLRSHTNCPLCRAGIVSNNVSPDAAMTALASMQQNTNTNSFDRNHQTQTENPRNNGELSNNLPGRAFSGVSENRAGTREAQELTDDSIYKENTNVEKNHIIQEHSHRIQIDEIKQVTRSVSMDYRLAKSCTIDREYDSEPSTVNLQKQDGTESTVFKRTRRSSVGQCLRVSPVCMKKSLSCSGRILTTRGSRI